jgi:hypothetical protein
VVHELHEVSRSEEHAAEALFNLFIAQHGSVGKNEYPEILADAVLLLTPPHNQVIIHKNYFDLLPESPELER